MSQSKDDKPQLVAKLGSFSAADALQWAKSSQFSGRLAFRSDEARITLHCEHGGITHAASSRRVEALGRHLFSEGLIDEVDLAAAIVHSRDSQSRIGASMVELGVLEPETLRQALHDHIVNLATLPVSWKTGWIQAESRPLENSPALRPEPVDAIFVLMEASRRLDALHDLDAGLASTETVLIGGGENLPDDAPARWHQVLATHEPFSSLGAHYERVGGSYFLFIATVQQLLSANILEVGEADHENGRDLAQTTV
ncbi:MAG: DUF4388 domain-containing protein [Acidobacteria bacterium]|nr:DUF4388 domain-containing protein [Acidobacteriota bacterium]